MAAGKPIIATSIGSHREVASQSEIALVVPPADASALCNAILELVQNPSQMARLGTNARALFQSQYTEERMLNTYKQLYFDLLGEKCPAGAASVKGCPSTSTVLPAG
jgi:glycosyltransferase involved in cell wall biosynthesis